MGLSGTEGKYWLRRSQLQENHWWVSSVVYGEHFRMLGRAIIGGWGGGGVVEMREPVCELWQGMFIWAQKSAYMEETGRTKG